MPGVEHVPVTWTRTAWVTAAAGKMQPVVIIDHVMQGWLTTMVNYALSAFPAADMRYVSPHFNIGTGGRVVQIESIFTPGIHASTYALNDRTAAVVRGRAPASPNAYSIGIEHEGFSVPLFTPDKMTPLLTAATWTAANPWPPAMVEASVRVKAWCFATAPTLGTPSRESIIGHYETGDANRVNDPAPAAIRYVWPIASMILALLPDTPAAGGLVHTVVRGDTLGAIAQRYGVTVAQLVAWNALADPNRLEVGQVLRLSAPAATPVPPAPAGPSAADIESARGVLRTLALDVSIAGRALANAEKELTAVRNTLDAIEQRRVAALARLGGES